MRPAYLNQLVTRREGPCARRVYVQGDWVGSVQENGGYWHFEPGGRAYATDLEAAEALAVTAIDGSLACSTFDAERIKGQAS